MSTPAEPILVFAGYVLDPGKRLLIGRDGVPVNISSRAFDTLYYLASHPHELIDKHRLMKAVWPNSVVEENNLNQQISTLRKILGEAPSDHRFIVTVTGRGYRFVQDVRQAPCAAVSASTESGAANAAPADGASPRDAPESGSRRRADVSSPNVEGGPALWRTSRPVAAAAAVMLIGVAALALLAGHEWRQSAGTQTQSIAVLPFADVSPNDDQSHFVDGLSEELLNALGRLDGLRVIGRTSSFSFKDKNQDAREVGAALGVQHVLEGSVRRDGERLRITAQLVDATNGSQLWAETYERTLGDVFAIQKEIADSVAQTLRLALGPARAAAAAGGTRNIEAYEAYLSARAATNTRGSTRASEAIASLERAVELDPDFALAWAALAEAYTFAVDFAPSSALSVTPIELQRRISRAALRAFELAPDAPETLRSAGMVSMQNRDWAEAERRLRRAAELAGPYDYDANFLYALFLINVGRTNDAIPYEERAIRAEPLLMRPVAFRAALHEMRGDLDQAEALLLKSAGLEGDEAMLREGLIMIELARRDRDGLRRVFEKYRPPPYPVLDNPSQALEDLRLRHAGAATGGAHGDTVGTALFASFLGDQPLALDALRGIGPTPSVHVLWRPAVREVRRLPEFAEVVRDLGLVDYWRASGDWGEFCREAAGEAITCD